jgi:hypothetical protein
MDETVTWVSGEGYFGIKGHFGITSMDRTYLNVSVLHAPSYGKRAPLAPRLLGDRVLIHSIGIDHRQIQVTLDTRSKHAPLTRRDIRSDRTFEVRGNRLVLVHETDWPISPVG